MVRVPQSMAPIVLGLTFKKMGAKKKCMYHPTISTASSLVDYGDFEQMVSDVGLEQMVSDVGWEQMVRDGGCDSWTDDRPGRSEIGGLFAPPRQN